MPYFLSIFANEFRKHLMHQKLYLICVTYIKRYKEMKAMYKFELAVYAGLTSKTLRRWTKPFDEELARMGVSPSTRLLPPAAVKFICEKLAIDL